MSLSRRRVIAGLCAAGFLAACSSPAEPPPADNDNQRAAAQGRALATGEMDRWAAIVGTIFEASGYRLKLEGVRALASVGVRPSEVTREQAFVAWFEVLSGKMPGDVIHALAAPGLGPFDVFLTAVDTAEAPNRMHAVFN